MLRSLTTHVSTGMSSRIAQASANVRRLRGAWRSSGALAAGGYGFPAPGGCGAGAPHSGQRASDGASSTPQLGQ